MYVLTGISAPEFATEQTEDSTDVSGPATIATSMAIGHDDVVQSQLTGDTHHTSGGPD